MTTHRTQRALELLRFLVLFPPVYCIAFWLMLPALLEQWVPVWRWPAAVLYALFVGGLK